MPGSKQQNLFGYCTECERFFLTSRCQFHQMARISVYVLIRSTPNRKLKDKTTIFDDFGPMVSITGNTGCPKAICLLQNQSFFGWVFGGLIQRDWERIKGRHRRLCGIILAEGLRDWVRRAMTLLNSLQFPL